MQFEDIRIPVLDDLRSRNNRFTTAYQIFHRLPADIQAQLSTAFPSPVNIPVGEGSGTPYTPANFISLALEHFKKYDDSIQKAYLDSADVLVNNISPGFKGEFLTIWTYRETSIS